MDFLFLRKYFVIIFCCLLFGELIEGSEDQRLINNLENIPIPLGIEGVRVKNYFQDCFNKDSLALPFLGSAIYVCQKYSLAVIVEGKELFQKGFKRFITLISPEEFNEFYTKLIGLKGEWVDLKKNNDPAEEKKIKNFKTIIIFGEAIEKHFIGLQKTCKKYIDYAFSNLKYSTDERYDLITKQLFGNEINEEIYEKWKKGWMWQTKKEERDTIFEKIGITYQEYLDDSEEYNNKLKNYYKIHHQFDWIKGFTNKEINNLFDYINNTQYLYKIFTGDEKYYLDLLKQYKFPSLLIFLIDSIGSERLNEIISINYNGNNVKNTVLQYLHYLYIEYLATGEKHKILFQETIESLAKKNMIDTSDIDGFMEFNINDLQWQVNKEIEKICTRKSKFDKNEINTITNIVKKTIINIERSMYITEEREEKRRSMILKILTIGGIGVALFYMLKKYRKR